MSAIENCRTAALGGHVARCEKCAHTQISYNSCRNRHCPKCQAAAAKDWLAAREADLLPVPSYHVVFTLPAAIADIAYQNKAVIYDILFKASAETLTTIAADPKHLGARVGITSVLHTWGSAMTHHPHVHMIVPGGGISLDRTKWVACRPGFFLSVRVLSRLLTREQAWKGLELKARDAREFLPPGLCTRCDVVEESATHYVRDATIAGADLREIITLENESKVTFFQATGPREGAIINELFEDETGALQLRFTCYIGLRDRTAPRSKPSRRNSTARTRAIKPPCCRR